MSVQFIYDRRLGIELPLFEQSWDALDYKIKDVTLKKWEEIRGTIPDRVKEFEEKIRIVHLQLSDEEDFETCCRLNEEMAELASIINDLWIWFRQSPAI
ncbi:hypothetical protein [Bacillus sp. JCM 19034]|uniref:hypothetical protein n=1 Tax=Bacillus sp. JCM 19034 TaxID=1481928 RepID=UPI00078531C3|nr:hypothetical protein [Bacillus sp. JCM 19034]